MTSYQKTSLRSVYWKKLNGTTFSLLDPESTGVGAQALNSIPQITSQYGRQASGKFKNILSFSAPPGDLDAIDLSFLEEIDDIHEILKLAYAQRGFYLQVLNFECPPTNNRALWKQLRHFKVLISGGNLGAGPNLDGSDAAIQDDINLKIEEYVHLVKTDLSSLTTTEAEDILCIAGLGDENDCLSGWPGADQILVIGAASGGGAPGNLLYSMNGGGTIAAVATDPTPFAENSGINNVALNVIDSTHFRVIVSRDTDAAAKAMISYQDFVWVGTTMTAASWNVVTIAATANADYVTAMYWNKKAERLYLAAAGDVYVNTDNGETDPGSAVFTGANAIAAFTMDEDGNIWAVAAANAILRELANNQDVFAARTGPSGGGAFTAISFADDGTMFAGNGTSLYKNTDKAGSTNGWASLKNFGANHAVKSIQCENGSSQCLKVVVDDTTPGAGEVWKTEDGGNTWRQVTESSNAGYNGVYYFASDINKAILVGDDDGATGVIEILQ